jgi:hypothetical protein
MASLNFLLLFLVLLLIFALPIALYLNQNTSDIFSLNPDEICFETWKGFNDDGMGNSSFSDGKFNLWINDTSGGWSLSKLSRGLMPHYWGLRYALLENEFEIKKGIASPDINLNIDLKLIDYQNYTVSNSSMNVAIVLFFDGLVTDYQIQCYQTELQFFSYYGDRIQKNQEWFFTWRNDSIAQFKLNDNLQKGQFKHYSINLLPYILKMMDYYDLNHVKLKHIEIFTEAYKGYCEFEVYSAKITVQRNLASPYLINYLPDIRRIIILLSLVQCLTRQRL